MKNEKELEKEKELAKERAEMIEKLKQTYVIRNFKTTSESFIFMKKMAKTLSTIEDLDKMKDEDISALFEVLDEKIIKYVVGGFVLLKGEKKNVKVDYEKEFIGKFQTLISIFMMAVQHLVGKVQGEGKQKAHKKNEQKIVSKRDQ